MSKVLFIVHDLYQEDNHFPLGIAYLAAVLRKEGHYVDVICQDVSHCSNDTVCSHIRATHPDIIGVGFLAARFRETVVPLCDRINAVKGNGWLVLGGHGASGCSEYVKEITGCDTMIDGEGERAIRIIVDSYTDVDPPFDWDWCYSCNGIKDLDEIPFPAWDLFPVNEYKRQLKMPGWEVGDFTLSVTASRGCVGKCTFCQRLSKGLRFRSMESVVDEIEILYGKYGINYIFFQDEMFVSSKKRMIEFHDALKKKKLLGLIKWGGDSRVDVIDKEMLEILKSTNVQFLDFGFESMDDNVLSLMKKKTTADQNWKCAQLTKSAGIPFNMNILWGMPGDTVESLRKNITFINEFNTYSFLRTIRPPTPYPGCELFDLAVEQGKLKGPADFFDRFTNSDLLTVNFTDIPDENFYMHLYQANADLIRQHKEHERRTLTKKFFNVYFNGETKFRGARHYA